MSLLLDTHVLLWAAGASERLSETVRARITDHATDVIFSVASLWEIAIKSALERPDFRVDGTDLRRALLSTGYAELPISGAHSLEIGRLPRLHRDPFDRMLVAQARIENLVLLTADAAVASYPGPIERI